MTLKELYHRIRPLAIYRAETTCEVPPAVYFFLAAGASVIGGLAIGFKIWVLAGFNPENSGGMLIFLAGSWVMSLISLILGLFWRNRAVFYGLNAFAFLTVSLLASSMLRALLS